MTREPVHDREIIAIRTTGPHDHIIRAKLADGWEGPVEEIIAAIKGHEAHYWSRGHLVRVEQCPDCLKEVIWT